jgi:uncharacterized protein YdhG (YjbR/CyaY superfamily)
MKNKSAKDIDGYIRQCPPGLRGTLQKIRATIRKAAPAAKEVISYRIPAFKQNGVLVYFAAFPDHISFFPTSSGVSNFEKDLKPYKTSRGTIQFPLDKPVPFALIGRITKFRAREDAAKAAGKKKK